MAMSRITHIVVHYSATQRHQDIGAAEIDRWHRDRGWRKIGYHYVVRLDGTIEKGRADHEVGAHVGGQNSGKLGVCWVGGLDGDPDTGRDTRTPAQMKALRQLITRLLREHPDAKVVGHRDLAPTQCPGFDAKAWWEGGDPKPAAPRAPVVTENVREDNIHVVEKGETLYGIAVEHGVAVDDLVKWNGLEDVVTIHPGQRLRTLPVGGFKNGEPDTEPDIADERDVYGDYVVIGLLALIVAVIVAIAFLS